MHELVVFRHGQAATPRDIHDFDRPLTGQGEAQVHRSATLLSARLDHANTALVASTALRARRTAEILFDVLQTEAERLYWEPRIYEASVPTLIDVLSGYSELAEQVVLIGHNPGLSSLAAHFLSQHAASGFRGLGTGAWLQLGLTPALRAGASELLGYQP